MRGSRGDGSPRSSFLTVLLILAMLAGPAALTLHRVRVPAVVDVAFQNPSPYGYTVSLLLFIVPIGVILDFFFAHLFLTFPNPAATLGIPAPALGACTKCHIFVGSATHIVVGSVPIEEYIFYFTGFITVLLLYIWLDEYWLSAYSVPGTDPMRSAFRR